MITCLTRLARVALAALLCTGCVAPSPAEPIAIPGTTVSLQAPPGFVTATDFSGLIADHGQASLLVAELPPEAAADVAALFTDLATARRAFATQGVEIAQLQFLQVQGAAVPVAIGTQAAHGQTFNKWVALYPGTRTVLITVQVPAGAAHDPADLMASLQSVTLGAPRPLEEKRGSLPFTAVPTAPFRIIDTLGGAAILMTAGERDVDPERVQPLLIIASQLSLPAGDLGTLSRTLLSGTRELQDGVVLSQRPVTFAGIEGQMITGALPNGRTFAHYLALWPGERYVRMVAILPPDQGDDVHAAVDSIARSVQFRDHDRAADVRND